MSIYLLKPNVTIYKWLTVKNDLNFRKFITDCNPVKNSWVPFEIEWIMDKKDINKKESDFPNLDGMPIFSTNAILILGKLLEANGEILPLILNNEKQFWAFNILSLFDILDLAESEIDWLPSGNIMRINKYVLKKIDKPIPDIFKIPKSLRGYSYISENMKELIEKSELTGFNITDISNYDA